MSVYYDRDNMLLQIYNENVRMCDISIPYRTIM